MQTKLEPKTRSFFSAINFTANKIIVTNDKIVTITSGETMCTTMMNGKLVYPVWILLTNTISQRVEINAEIYKFEFK